MEQYKIRSEFVGVRNLGFYQTLTCRLAASYWPPGNGHWKASHWEFWVQWRWEELWARWFRREVSL